MVTKPFLIIVFLALFSCSFKKSNNNTPQAPNDGSSSQRPDTAGIPPNTLYIAGAQFFNSKVRLASTEKPISIPDYTTNRCSSISTPSGAHFVMTFSNKPGSTQENHSLIVSLLVGKSPQSGQEFVFSWNDGMSVSLTVPTTDDFVPASWGLDSDDKRTLCNVKIERILNRQGQDIPYPKSGFFRLEARMSCTLRDFFEGSKLLDFDAALVCEDEA